MYLSTLLLYGCLGIQNYSFCQNCFGKKVTYLFLYFQLITWKQIILKTFMKKLTMKTAESLRTYSCITCSVIVSYGPSINDVELQRALIFDALSLQFIYFENSPIIKRKRTHFGFGRLEFLVKFEIGACWYVLST